MKFIEITADQFRAYAKTSPYQSFMQTPEIAQLRQQLGWTPYYLAVVDKSTSSRTASTQKTRHSAKSDQPTILAATLVVAKPTFLGYQTFYAPGGPLLDLENTKLTNFFFKHLIAFAREHHGFTLHIDPYYELVERDIDGQIVENGFNHQTALKNLQKLGFRPLSHTSMPRYLFAKDFQKSDTPENVFSRFKQNTRNLTRRAERLGVTVRELDREELPILKQITSDTAARRHFVDQPLSYYQQMYDLFTPQDQVKFLLAEADGIPLSVAMFMIIGHEVVYLYSGSDDRYMKKYNAQYLIQWHMIRYALEHGFSRYNFYGLQALPTSPSVPGYGVYRFKKGFGGHVIELIDSFELPLNQPIYQLHSFLSNLKHLLRR